MPAYVTARSSAPASIARSSPLRPIHSAGSPIAATIDARKTKDRRGAGHRPRDLAPTQRQKKPAVSTSEASPAPISPSRTRFADSGRTASVRPTLAMASDSISLRLDQPATNRVTDQFDAVAHAELAHRGRAVVLDGLLREVKDRRDLLVGVSLGDQLHDLLLAGGELVGAPGALAQDVLDQRPLRLRGEERLSALDRTHRLQ